MMIMELLAIVVHTADVAGQVPGCPELSNRWELDSGM